VFDIAYSFHDVPFLSMMRNEETLREFGDLAINIRNIKIEILKKFRKNTVRKYTSNMPSSESYTMVVDRSCVGLENLVIQADFPIPDWTGFPVKVYKPGDEVPKEHMNKCPGDEVPEQHLNKLQSSPEDEFGQ